MRGLKRTLEPYAVHDVPVRSRTRQELTVKSHMNSGNRYSSFENASLMLQA